MQVHMLYVFDMMQLTAHHVSPATWLYHSAFLGDRPHCSMYMVPNFQMRSPQQSMRTTKHYRLDSIQALDLCHHRVVHALLNILYGHVPVLQLVLEGAKRAVSIFRKARQALVHSLLHNFKSMSPPPFLFLASRHCLRLLLDNRALSQTTDCDPAEQPSTTSNVQTQHTQTYDRLCRGIQGRESAPDCHPSGAWELHHLMRKCFLAGHHAFLRSRMHIYTSLCPFTDLVWFLM